MVPMIGFRRRAPAPGRSFRARWLAPTAVAAALLLAPRHAPAQEIRADVLARLKAATVFIQVPPGSGSGFLFRKTASTGYLLTCEHVVRGANVAHVVFTSGATDEKRCDARVIAIDPDSDLACLLVKDVKELPTPLEIESKTDLKETETIYAAGFPFGQMLSASGRGPEISLAKATVSSIRRGYGENVVAVQLSGDINPGNSGGPVIDSAGRVIGVAQSKIAQSSTAFAVPPEIVRAFLRGRVKGVRINPLTQSDTSARLEAVAEVSDPLGTLKGIGIAFIRGDALQSRPQANREGRWDKVHPSMKEASLKMNDQTGFATGVFDMARGAGDPAEIGIVYQCRHVQSDGATVWTPPMAMTVHFVKKEVVAAQNAAKAAVEPERPAPKGDKTATGDVFPIAMRLPLRAAVASLILSRDGDHLYVLDLSDCKVYKIEAATLKIAFEVRVADDAVAMALSPSGNTLFVAARGVVSPVRGGTPGFVGILQAIEAKEMRIFNTFTIELDPGEIGILGQGSVLVSGASGGGGLYIVEPGKRSVVDRLQFPGGCFFRVHPDDSRIYTGFGSCILLKKDPQTGGHPTHGAQRPIQQPGRPELSPDGRFLLNTAGPVFRISSNPKADFQPAGTIEPCLALAMAKGLDTFYASTEGGFIKEYNADNFELKKSVHVQKVCSLMQLDARRMMLYAVVAPLMSNVGSSPSGRRIYVGDLVAFSLTGK